MIAISVPMPANCVECPFDFDTDKPPGDMCRPYYKDETGNFLVYKDSRPDDCPLIEMGTMMAQIYGTWFTNIKDHEKFHKLK